MKIVICGGGIIGTSCAYFLAQRNLSSTIIEQDDIACGASGKAGGFLAKTWCKSNSTDALAKLSYGLHMDLSKGFTNVDYRNVNTYSVNIDENSSKSKKKNILSWIDGPANNCSLLDTTENTSQVHPKKFCQKLLEEAKRLTNNETKVIYDTVSGINFDHSNTLPVVKSVKLKSGALVEADIVLITMGPWSSTAISWFPKNSVPHISGHRAHSIVLKVPENVQIPADCIFLEYKYNNDLLSPEFYPRPDGTVYLCGLGDDPELPERVSEVKVEDDKCNQLRKMANLTCSALDSSETLAEQACFLPISPDGIPVIGPIETVQGAYIATGHSCWGILNSTGTGFALAELISTGKCQSINLKPFRPSRFY